MFDIGVIGALSQEVGNLISTLRDAKCESYSGIDFHAGKIGEKSVVVAKCGVGKVFAAICAEAMILKYSPKLIINTGVGGALDKTLKTGDIVIAKSLVQHDMDTSALGDPKGLVSGINTVYFEADSRAVSILQDAAAALSLSYLSGTVATGDKFISDCSHKERIAGDFLLLPARWRAAPLLKRRLSIILRLPLCAQFPTLLTEMQQWTIRHFCRWQQKIPHP